MNHPELVHTLVRGARRCVGCLSTRSGWFKHIEPQRTLTNHTSTELLARCSSGWFKHSEPTRTTPSQCSRCVGHSFGVVEAQRTSSHLQETHHHRASTVWRVLLHYVGVVQAPRTYTNHTILTSTELARCEGCLSTSSGWFKHSEPHRTCTNHTITELARCVGCFCTSSGGSSTSNLHEPHQHSSSKVCRVLLLGQGRMAGGASVGRCRMWLGGVGGRRTVLDVRIHCR